MDIACLVFCNCSWAKFCENSCGNVWLGVLVGACVCDSIMRSLFECSAVPQSAGREKDVIEEEEDIAIPLHGG